MKDLKAKTIRGGAAKSLSQATNFVVRLGSLMVMARLLDAREFGLVAMVGAVTGVFNLLRDAGLSMATVQRASVTDEQLSTLFWINIGLGAALTAASAALAPALVAFYHEPRLFWVTVVSGLGFLINAMGVQHSALLQRQMRFVTLALIETASLLLSTGAGILMAIHGFGYWALVAMGLVSPAVSSAGMWLSVAWVPGRPRTGIGIRSMLRFGGTVTLNSLVVYAGYNLDKVVLGRFWGAGALGLYGRAYQLVNIPTDSFNAAVGGVAFSALSRLQDDPARLRNYFLKGYALALAVTLPVTVACLVFAEDIIRVALGPNWTDAVQLLRLLSPTILVFALINPLSWLMLSANLAARSLRIALVIAPLVSAAYLVALPHGPAGVALAFSAVMTLLAVPVSAWAIRGSPVSLRDLIRVASQPMLSGALAGAACLLLQPAISRHPSPLLRLVLGGAVLISVYLWMLLHVMGQKAFYLDIYRGLKKRSPAEGAG